MKETLSTVSDNWAEYGNGMTFMWSFANDGLSFTIMLERKWMVTCTHTQSTLNTQSNIQAHIQTPTCNKHAHTRLSPGQQAVNRHLLWHQTSERQLRSPTDEPSLSEFSETSFHSSRSTQTYLQTWKRIIAHAGVITDLAYLSNHCTIDIYEQRRRG